MVSTPTVMAALIPAFSTCLFHVVPRVPGGVANEKTGPVVPYRRMKPVLIVSVYLVARPKCNYWIALMYYKISLTVFRTVLNLMQPYGTRNEKQQPLYPKPKFQLTF